MGRLDCVFRFGITTSGILELFLSRHQIRCNPSVIARRGKISLKRTYAVRNAFLWSGVVASYVTRFLLGFIWICWDLFGQISPLSCIRGALRIALEAASSAVDGRIA
jgi:hypothetical protein